MRTNVKEKIGDILEKFYYKIDYFRHKVVSIENNFSRRLSLIVYSFVIFIINIFIATILMFIDLMDYDVIKNGVGRYIYYEAIPSVVSVHNAYIEFFKGCWNEQGWGE